MNKAMTAELEGALGTIQLMIRTLEINLIATNRVIQMPRLGARLASP